MGEQIITLFLISSALDMLDMHIVMVENYLYKTDIQKPGNKFKY